MKRRIPHKRRTKRDRKITLICAKASPKISAKEKSGRTGVPAKTGKDRRREEGIHDIMKKNLCHRRGSFGNRVTDHFIIETVDFDEKAIYGVTVNNEK